MTTLVVAGLTAALLVGLVSVALPMLGVMDVPNHRSSHARPVPRGGGLALVPCMAISIATTQAWSAPLAWMLLGAAALGAVGMADDVRDLPPVARLMLQIAVSAVVGGVLVTSFSDLTAAACALAVLVATVWLTGCVNVFNFMDGANGVAGLQIATAGAWSAYVGHREDVPSLLVAGLALLGVALGFLPWNYPKARVFLGDVGSYSIGLVLGALALVTLIETHEPLLALAPWCVFLTDTTLSLARRLAAGKPVMSAHREHIYQRLTAVPGSPWPAAATGTTSALCALAAGALGAVWCLLSWAIVLTAYVGLPQVVHRLAAGTARRA